MGPPGNGKPHLAAAIANALRARGRPALFMRVPDLMDLMRQAYDEQAIFVQSLGETGSMSLLARLETIRRVPVLILDDLATEKATEWVDEKRYQILDFRTVERLPTVITTNISPEEWVQKLGARIADRLGNRLLVRVVHNAAVSYRQGEG